MPQRTLHKGQRLKSEISIQALFSKGKSFVAYPLRICYAPSGDAQTKIMVSVPKRLFKRAVKRNLLKRRIREAYRLRQDIFSQTLNHQPHNIAFSYISPEIMPSHSIAYAMEKALKKLDNAQPLINKTNHEADWLYPYIQTLHATHDTPAGILL